MFGCSVEISCGTSKFHQYSFPPSRLTYFGTYIDLCGSNAVHLPLSAFLALSAMLRVISRPTLRNPLEEHTLRKTLGRYRYSASQTAQSRLKF